MDERSQVTVESIRVEPLLHQVKVGIKWSGGVNRNWEKSDWDSDKISTNRTRNLHQKSSAFEDPGILRLEGQKKTATGVLTRLLDYKTNTPH